MSSVTSKDFLFHFRNLGLKMGIKDNVFGVSFPPDYALAHNFFLEYVAYAWISANLI